MANRKITDLPNLTTPADADLVPFVDASNTTESAQGTSVKVLWSNIKATLKTYFDTLYPAISDLTSYLRSDVADTKTAGDLTLNDNVKIALGTAGAESEIYSDSADTNVNLKSGDLLVKNNGTLNGYIGRADNIIKWHNTIIRDNATGATVISQNNASGNIFFRPLSNTDFTNQLSLSNLNVLTYTGTIISQGTGTNSFSGQVTVPADTYDGGWNGDFTVPTKNDVYDEMETKATESSGTSTPTLIAATSGSYSIGGTQICNYVKIGKLVHVNFRLTSITSTSPVGAFRIDLNLPFSYTVVGDNFLNVGYIRNTSLTTSEIDSIRLQLSSSSFASFSDSDAVAYTNVTFTAGIGELFGSGTFLIS